MKAVVPAAGLGTRMLPATKNQPKEMLPIVDRPAIQWVVEEAAAAGADEVVVVTGPQKRVIEEHFAPSPSLREHLERTGNKDALRRLDEVEDLGRRVRFVEQPSPRGLGDAILRARHAVGGEPFACLLGDDVLVDGTPAARRCMDAQARHGGHVLLVQEVPAASVHKYGILDPARPAGAEAWRVRRVVEKPRAEAAPSRWAAVGRYAFDPSLFDVLAATPPDAKGEVQLADALQTALATVPVHAVPFAGERFDTGSFEGWLEANVALARRAGLGGGAPPAQG